MTRKWIALLLAALLLAAAAAGALAEADEWPYEYFFGRVTEQNSTYLGFDMDKMVVRYFQINSKGQHVVMKQTFTGDAEAGFSVNWLGDSVETITIVGEDAAVLTNDAGEEFEYRILPPEEGMEIIGDEEFQSILTFMG